MGPIIIEAAVGVEQAAEVIAKELEEDQDGR